MVRQFGSGSHEEGTAHSHATSYDATFPNVMGTQPGSVKGMQ